MSAHLRRRMWYVSETMSEPSDPQPKGPRAQRRPVRFGDGVLESAEADAKEGAFIWSSARGYLIPAALGLGYAVYRVFTAN